MITIKIKIKETSDNLFILNKQMEYSYAFRKMYNNIDSINPEYYKNKFNLNDIEFRSCLSEVKTKHNQVKTIKIKLEEKIIKLENEISYYKTLPKSNKNNRIIFKLTKRISSYNKQLSKDIVFGGKNNLSVISYLSNIDSDKKEIYKDQYLNGRILPLFVYNNIII